MLRSPTESTKRSLNDISPENPTGVDPKRKPMEELKSETVGSMSQDNLLAAIGLLLDGKLEHLASKEDIKNLQQEITKVKQECDILKLEVRSLREDNALLRNKVESQERHQKSCNLIFKQVPEDGLIPSETIHNFCRTTLGIERKLHIKNAYRFGRVVANKCRPILVEYLLQEDTRFVLDKTELLKDTNVVIHRDRTENSRKVRSLLFELKDEINRNNNKVKLEVRGQQLVVNKKFFTFTNDYKLFTRDGVAVEELSKAVGFDVTDLMVRVLDNFLRRIENNGWRNRTDRMDSKNKESSSA